MIENMSENSENFNALSLRQKYELSLINAEYQYKLDNHLNDKITIGIKLTPDDITEQPFDYYQTHRDIVRWKCPDNKHYPKREDIIKFNETKDGFFGEILEYCESLECVDFRGLELDSNLVNIICNLSDTLKCCHFDMIQITENNWTRLVLEIAPKLEHISIGSYLMITDNDNNYFDPLDLLFSEAKQLKNCSIVFYDNSILQTKSLRNLSSNTNELAIYNKDNNGDNCKQIIEDMTKAKLDDLKQLMFISKSGNGSHIMQDFARFLNKNGKKLESMCLNLFGLQHYGDYWKLIKYVKSLQDLTLHFNDCKAHVVFVGQITQFPSLKILNLANLQLNIADIQAINKAFPNITLLKLRDCQFIEMRETIEYLTCFENLQNLHISYALPSDPKYNFRNECLESIHYFLENSNTLREISLINWPQLEINQLNHCNGIAQQKGILFNIH